MLQEQSALFSAWPDARVEQAHERWEAIGDPACFETAIRYVVHVERFPHALEMLRQFREQRQIIAEGDELGIRPEATNDELEEFVTAACSAFWSTRPGRLHSGGMRSWLLDRYDPMWKTATIYVHPSEWAVLRAVTRAMVAGSWDAALHPLLKAADVKPVRVRVFPQGSTPQCRRATWSLCLLQSLRR